MFGSRKSNSSQNQNHNGMPEPISRNLIGKGTEIQGEIVSEGAIRFEGVLKGLLESKSKVIIGQTGYIKGDIVCESCEIAGKFEGKLNVKGILSLKSTAKVEGEINTAQLVIEPGALFNGNCNMGSKAVNKNSATIVQKAQEKVATKEAI